MKSFHLDGFLLKVGTWIAVLAFVLSAFTTAMAKSDEQTTGSLQVFVQSNGVVPRALVLFDQKWQPVATAQPSTSIYTFTNIEAGKYHVLAFLKTSALGAQDEVEIKAGKLAIQSLSTTYSLSSITPTGASLAGYSGYECVSAWDGGQKVTAGCFGPVVGFYPFVGNPHNTYVTHAKFCFNGVAFRYSTDCAVYPVLTCIPGRCGKNLK